MRDSLSSTLESLLPTVTKLDQLLAKEPPFQERAPIVAGKLAAPYELEWRNGELIQATFEIYDVKTTWVR